jgi:hypothetical protein
MKKNPKMNEQPDGRKSCLDTPGHLTLLPFFSFSFDRSASKTGEEYENRIRKVERSTCQAFSWPMLVSKSTAVEDCDLGFVIVT